MIINIDSPELCVAINPEVGGTIIGVKHLRSGMSVLGSVPWDTVDEPLSSCAAREESEWLTRFTGGWPLLFPNGGDACTFEGVFHGFHGEASIAPWNAASTTDTVRLTRRFVTVPVEMNRELTVQGELLIIRERLRMTGPRAIDVMWGHHATFGSDLLGDDIEITSSARRVFVDESYDPAANPLLPGAAGNWPMAAGKLGPVDLRRPQGTMAALAYLHDFAQAWAAIRRLDNRIALALSWDAACFPCAWLWHELGGTPDAPWHGRGRVIGIEPNTTMPALGIARAKACGGQLLRLHPGADLNTMLRLHVFEPSGPILALDDGGQAIN
jgi:hypothetical protein